MEVLLYSQEKALNGPGNWSSFSDILVNNNNKKNEKAAVKSMNSVQELRSTYDHQHNRLHRNSSVGCVVDANKIGINNNRHFKTAATTYDFPDHSNDSAPASSLTSKKDNASKKWSLGNIFFRRKKKDESDSSSNEDTKQRKDKKKSEKKHKTKRSYFDHIVIPPPNKNRSFGSNQYFGGQNVDFDGSIVNRPLPKVPKEAKSSRGSNSSDSVSKSPMNGRRSRKELTKQRAVARRDSLTRGESSDEDSQRSHSSSKFRSDDSLSMSSRTRDNSLSRRSRAARTERYIRRLSKDEESILNREALQRQARENWQLKLNHYDYNGYATKTENSDMSGLFTMPPSHFEAYRKPTSMGRTLQDDVDNSRAAIIPPYGNNHYRNGCFNLRSWSCESNMHEMPSPEVMRKSRSIRTSSSFSESPNSYYKNLVKYKQPPPPPPPRDPKRITDARPVSGFNGIHNQGVRNCPDQNTRRYFYNNRTASEDQINLNAVVDLHPRPSSATNEKRQLISQRDSRGVDNYKYLTEKKARSRKPIFIQSTDKINVQNYNNYAKSHWETKNPKVPPSSPTPMFTAQTTNVTTKIYLPNGTQNITTNQIPHNNNNNVQRTPSPFKPITNTFDEESSQISVNTSSEKEEEKRKSANLEEALDELEAIYKSLHLGDDDLLERAEEREISLATRKMIEKNNENYPQMGCPNDTTFNYEPFSAKSNYAKRRTLERKCDDMAFRKMNKSTVIPSKNSPVNNISYLLASPVHSHSPDDLEVEAITTQEEELKEPDVTLDDVVYRTIRHCNNTLRVIDPQPPFGIPIGPVTQAPASDYLHASPSADNNNTCKRSKSPDIVKDDLAFRNLRKDSNKEPALKCTTPENMRRHNRAVRSLSANISNILQQRPQARIYDDDNDVENEFNTTSLSDIADAMEIAHQILKEKENRIMATRRAFFSDSDTKHYKCREKNSGGQGDISESRHNFLNNMRSAIDYNSQYLAAKPPVTPENCKESNKEKQSSYEEVLSAFEAEAKETNERINADFEVVGSSVNEQQCKKTEKLMSSTAQTAESYPLEEVEDRLELIPPPMESVANVIMTPENGSDFDLYDKCTETNNHLSAREEIQSNKSPFEEHKADLIASFKELDKYEEGAPGETSVVVVVVEGVASALANNFDNAADENSAAVSTADACSANSTPSCDDFCVANVSNNIDCGSLSCCPATEELESPKLVTSAMKGRRDVQSKDKESDVRKCLFVPSPPECSSSSGSSRATGSGLTKPVTRSPKKTSTWYGDPLVLAFACSYGVACSYQVASLDIVTILGLLFVIISIVVALLLDQR